MLVIQIHGDFHDQATLRMVEKAYGAIHVFEGLARKSQAQT